MTKQQLILFVRPIRLHKDTKTTRAHLQNFSIYNRYTFQRYQVGIPQNGATSSGSININLIVTTRNHLPRN